MGEGLANLLKLLNPDIVILSGPLIKHSNLFYQIYTETALNKSHKHKEGGFFFSRGGFYNEIAIAVGASALVLEKYLDNSGLN